MDSGRIRACLKKIQDDPYDLESWSLVIKDAQTKRIDDSRDIFERLVAFFPTSGRYWKVYIEQEVCRRIRDRARFPGFDTFISFFR